MALAMTQVRGVRLSRIELRRNAMLWMLPVAVALFWYQAYRHTMALPAVWTVREISLQNTAPLDFCMPVAGAAAWMGWRDSRRRMTEMLDGLPTPRFMRQLVTWTATTSWAVLGYLLCMGVVYVATAIQAHRHAGSPQWWPLVVGVAAVMALSALGFAFGALLPSRFTAPLVVLAVFFGLGFSISSTPDSHSPMLVSPVLAPTPDHGAGAPGAAGGLTGYLPDLPIVQLAFAAGLTLVLLGILAVLGSGSRRLRIAAVVVLSLGLAAGGLGLGLASTARLTHGMVTIPALR